MYCWNLCLEMSYLFQIIFFYILSLFNRHIIFSLYRSVVFPRERYVCAMHAEISRYIARHKKEAKYNFNKHIIVTAICCVHKLLLLMISSNDSDHSQIEQTDNKRTDSHFSPCIIINVLANVQ